MKIVVNGIELTYSQMMTIHVALQSFAVSLLEENSLGDDKHGKIMRQSYLNCIKQINSLTISG